MASRRHGVNGTSGTTPPPHPSPPDGVTLLNFFVFNASLCKREGEEEKKILYYYPPEEDIDRKIKNVGLCEAVAKFTETFAPDTPVECIHSQKKRTLLHQPEPEYWMVLTVSVPFGKAASPVGGAEKETGHAGGTNKAEKDKGVEYEYQEDDVSDKVLQSVLHHCYKMFKLFMGTFAYIVSNSSSGVASLSSRLEHFYSRYLSNLRLHSADLLDVFGGIHFLPLDKTTFLRIQCFINAVEERFPAVKYTAFLYNDLLVWSSLAQVDIRILYSYLTKSLLRESGHLEHDLGSGLTYSPTPTFQQSLIPATSPRAAPSSFHYPMGASPGSASSSDSSPRGSGSVSSSSAGRPTTPSTSRAYGSFVTGPTSGVKSSEPPRRVPKVFVNTSRNNEECHLVVYRALSATLCLLTDADFPLVNDFYAELEAYLGQPMAELASDIGEQYTKTAAQASRNGPGDPHHSQTNWKYLYFNHMNLAQKTSFHNRSGAQSAASGSWGWDWSGEGAGGSGKEPHSPMVAEIMGILSDTNTDLGRLEGGGDGETIVKTYRDQWVVGKKSDEREVYVVIHQKNANLIEINEQLKTLCNSHFSNIFFLD